MKKHTSAAIRRVLKTNQKMNELGYSNILEAVLHAEKMQAALRAIHALTEVPGALDAQHVKELTEKALRIDIEDTKK